MSLTISVFVPGQTERDVCDLLDRSLGIALTRSDGGRPFAWVFGIHISINTDFVPRWRAPGAADLTIDLTWYEGSVVDSAAAEAFMKAAASVIAQLIRHSKNSDCVLLCEDEPVELGEVADAPGVAVQDQVELLADGAAVVDVVGVLARLQIGLRPDAAQAATWRASVLRLDVVVAPGSPLTRQKHDVSTAVRVGTDNFPDRRVVLWELVRTVLELLGSALEDELLVQCYLSDRNRPSPLPGSA